MFQLNCVDTGMLSGYSRRSAHLSSVFFLKRENDVDHVALIKKNIIRNYRNTVIFDHVLKEDLSKDKYPFLIKQQNPNIDEHFFHHSVNNFNTDLKPIIELLINQEMNMSIPLWDIHYVKSEEDHSQVAVIFRVHHGVVDGESRTNNFKYLFDDNIAPRGLVSVLRLIDPSAFSIKLIHACRYSIWKIYKIYNRIRVSFLKPVYRQEYNNLYDQKWDYALSTTKSVDFFNINYDLVRTTMEKYGIDFRTLFIYLFSTTYRNLMKDVNSFDSDKSLKIEGKNVIAGVPMSMNTKRDHLYGSQVYTMLCDTGLSVNDDMARLATIKQSLSSEKEFYNKSPVRWNCQTFLRSPYVRDLVPGWTYMLDTFWDEDKQQAVPLGRNRPFGIYMNQTKTFDDRCFIGNSEVNNFYSIPPLGKHDGTLGCCISIRSPQKPDGDVLIGFIFFKSILPNGDIFKEYMHAALDQLLNGAIDHV